MTEQNPDPARATEAGQAAAEPAAEVSVESSVESTVESADEPSVEALVGSWLTVPDVAERLGVPLSQVRRMLEERELLGLRVGERRILQVPEQFLDETVLHHLRGTVTVLADGGMDDEEVVRWLFTADDTLGRGGTPVDALRDGFKTEVRRRAMETAF